MRKFALMLLFVSMFSVHASTPFVNIWYPNSGTLTAGNYAEVNYYVEGAGESIAVGELEAKQADGRYIFAQSLFVTETVWNGNNYSWFSLNIGLTPGKYRIRVSVFPVKGDTGAEDVSGDITIVGYPRIASVNPTTPAVGNTVTVNGSNFQLVNTVTVSTIDGPYASLTMTGVVSKDGSTLSFKFPTDLIQYSGGGEKGITEGESNGKVLVPINGNDFCRITIETGVGGYVAKTVMVVDKNIYIFDSLQGKICKPDEWLNIGYAMQGFNNVSLRIHKEFSKREEEIGSVYNLNGVGGWSFNLSKDIGPGNYYVTLGDHEAAAKSGVFTVNPVYAPLQVLATSEYPKISEDGLAPFKCLATGGDGKYTYEWRGLDIEHDGGDTVFGSFSGTGYRSVSVMVRSGDGQHAVGICTIWIEVPLVDVTLPATPSQIDWPVEPSEGPIEPIDSEQKLTVTVEKDSDGLWSFVYDSDLFGESGLTVKTTKQKKLGSPFIFKAMKTPVKKIKK